MSPVRATQRLCRRPYRAWPILSQGSGSLRGVRPELPSKRISTSGFRFFSHLLRPRLDSGAAPSRSTLIAAKVSADGAIHTRLGRSPRNQPIRSCRGHIYFGQEVLRRPSRSNEFNFGIRGQYNGAVTQAHGRIWLLSSGKRHFLVPD